jgi:two-component system, OmpR family, KDP operon response regulator KdpE
LNATYGTVLVVDHESSIRRALCVTLSNLGFVTVEAGRSEEAMFLVRKTRFHAVLLNTQMPGMGGIETCRSMRRTCRRLPILMVSVRDSEDDKVEALDAGADDYITKPFRPRELTARLRAAIRRTQLRETEGDEPICVGDISLDPVRHLVEKCGQAIYLTPKEFEMLHFLMVHAGRPIPHARLLNSVWGPEYGSELVYLRTLVRKLRRKLEDDPAHPKYLLTDMNIGYRFHDQTYDP